MRPHQAVRPDQAMCLRQSIWGWMCGVGRVMVKRVLVSVEVVRVRVPPLAIMRRRLMLSPMPEPVVFVVK